MGSFITKTNLKSEMSIDTLDTDYDSLLDALATAVENIFDELTGRILLEGERTEYYNSEAYGSKIFLKNRPVKSQSDIQVWDDPDWEWGSDSLIAAADIRVNLEVGIVYYDGSFFEGSQSIKVVYTAGYTVANIPASIKEIFVRQACHWYSDAKSKQWALISISHGTGAGSITKRELRNSLLPDFDALVTREMS